jgi:hypothetical protein
MTVLSILSTAHLHQLWLALAHARLLQVSRASPLSSVAVN